MAVQFCPSFAAAGVTDLSFWFYVATGLVAVSGIGCLAGVTSVAEDLSADTTADILAKLRTVTNIMDEAQVAAGSRILFITPTVVLQDRVGLSSGRWCQ